MCPPSYAGFSNSSLNQGGLKTFPLEQKTTNAPVRLFCPHPPLGTPGVRGKMCVIKKGGALENEVKIGGAVK